MHLRRGLFGPKLIGEIGAVNLVVTLGFASVSTIWAIYLNSFLENTSYVGFISSFFTVIGFLSYFFLIPLIEKKDKVKLYSLTLVLYILSYTLFALLPNIYAVIVLGSLISVIGSLRITSFGILVRDKSKDNRVAESEGIIYTANNLAWLLGPMVGGFVAARFDFGGVFIFAALFIIVALFLFRTLNLRDISNRKRIDKNIPKIFIDFFKNKKRVISYIISGGINFWWVLIYIYMPIYIIKEGLSDIIVGYFLGAVIIPLVLTSYYFGRLVTRIGFKKIFITGHLILAISAFLCFLLNSIYPILVILGLASFGAAMVESTTEAFFFDVITKKQREKYYGPYNTTIDLAYFLANGLSGLLLLILPFRFLFLMYGLAMVIFSVISAKIKDVIESRRGLVRG